MHVSVRTMALVLAGGFVMGCQTTGDAWTKANDNISVCFKAMHDDPQLARVNAKFARHDPTPAQLSDRSVPTDAEADELRLRVQRTAPCRELRLAAIGSYKPLLEPAYAVLYYQADQVFFYLQQQAISYGTANRLSAAALETFRRREADYDATDDRARAAAAGALREQLQQGHSAPPPTPRMRCTWEGMNVACN